MTERPLTTAEAATYLSVNIWQVRDYINQGLLRGYKLGNGTYKKGSRRRWRIWKQDLNAFINKSPNIKECND